MRDEQYRLAAEVFQEAVDLEGDDRRAFLDRACGEDAELRAYVAELLAEDTAEEDLFEESRLRMGHDLLVEALGVDSAAPASPEGPVPSTAPLPETIGRYRILAKLGEGGMGAVFLAEQDHPHRRVALKMIRQAVLSPALRKRFRFEAEVLGRLQHPGIAQIHDAGEVETEIGPQPYFAMEYVEGVELRHYAKSKALDARARLELVARIADAVHHAHQKGIVHRDLKPENVLVQDAPTGSFAGVDSEFALPGQPKILDFGVARATDADVQLTTVHTGLGQIVGTLPYMSPEQIAGDSRRLDTRSDIYALGVLLYELLAGRPPFELGHRSIVDAARIIREEEPTRLGSINTVFRGDVDTIALKALEKDRERRYASAADLAADIRRYLANQPIIAHPPSTFYQLRKFAQRHKGLVVGLAATVLALIAGVIVSVAFALRAVEGEERALRGEAAAERHACRQSLAAAQAVGTTDSLRALAHLGAVPERLRDWEWRHLHARFDSHLAQYEGTGKPIQMPCVARAPGGRLVAAVQHGAGIRLLDLESGEVVQDFSADEELRCSCLAPEGTHLAAFSRDGHRAYLWKIGSKTGTRRIPLLEARLRWACFSPDGRWLAVCHHPDRWALVDTETGRSIPKPEGATMEWVVGFDADGRRLIAARSAEVEFSLVPEGKRLFKTHYHEAVNCCAASAATGRIALGQLQRMIRILDASTFEVLDILRGHNGTVACVAFSRDGRYLASAALDRTIRVWDVEKSETVRVLPWNPGSEPTAFSLAFSADGSLLAAGTTSTARVWRWREEGPRVLEGHLTYVYHVEHHPRAPIVASGDYGGLVLLWDALSGDRLAAFSGNQTARYLGFTPDGDRLVVGRAGGGYTLGFAFWDPFAGRRLREPRAAGDLALLEAARATTSERLPCFFCRVSGGARAMGGWSPGEAMASSPDGKYMIRPSKENHRVLELRELESGRRVRTIGAHEASIHAAAFSPDGRRVVSGDQKGLIKVWDLDRGDELATLTGHSGEVYAIAYHPNGTRFASSGNDATILLWDTRHLEPVLALRGHAAYVHSLCFSPDGTRLVSGSGDHTVRIWDSVAPAMRWKQIRQARALRCQAEPRVERLLAEYANPLDVADRIRGDRTSSTAQRRAALRVLMMRAAARREKQR